MSQQNSPGKPKQQMFNPLVKNEETERKLWALMIALANKKPKENK